MCLQRWGRPAAGVVPLLGLTLLVATCTSSLAPELATRTPTGQLTPYLTPSPSQTPAETVPLLTPTPKPLPTATPFTYTIAEGDTLLAIAYQFGVTVDEILTFNPGLNPQFLSVGAQLVIPIGEGGQLVIPSPTPVAVVAGQAQCHPGADQGLWCFLPASNENLRPIEGLTAEISLFSQTGVLLARQQALPPVNLIPAGRTLPLVTYFPPPVPFPVDIHQQLRTSFELSPGDTRYLPVTAEQVTVQIAADSRAASVHGEVLMGGEGDTPVEALIWVAVVAYTADWDVAGVRRWERQAELIAGIGLPFEIQVFSVNQPITRVEVFAEARPLALIQQK